MNPLDSQNTPLSLQFAIDNRMSLRYSSSRVNARYTRERQSPDWRFLFAPSRRDTAAVRVPPRGDPKAHRFNTYATASKQAPLSPLAAMFTENRGDRCYSL